MVYLTLNILIHLFFKCNINKLLLLIDIKNKKYITSIKDNRGGKKTI